MKSNIFLVHTEYHLMLSVNLIFDKYTDYNNLIYYTKRSSRLSGDFFSCEKYIRFSPIIDQSSLDIYREMCNVHPENFFYFQSNSATNLYIAYNLHRNGTKISLIQDGLKPYVVWNKSHEFLSMVKDTFLTYKELFSKKMYLYKVMPIYYYRYGRDKFIDELWFSYPEKFPYNTTKTKHKLPLFSSSSLDFINRLFDFEINKYDLDSVLIVGQPAESIDIENEDIKIITQIAHVNNNVLYKPHPLTQKRHLERIQAIPNIRIVKDGFPVELLMLQLKDTLIISRHSTSMLTNNPSCRYYWTHRLYPKSNLTNQLNIINPTNHIIEVEDINEIV